MYPCTFVSFSSVCVWNSRLVPPSSDDRENPLKIHPGTLLTAIYRTEVGASHSGA